MKAQYLRQLVTAIAITCLLSVFFTLSSTKPACGETAGWRNTRGTHPAYFYPKTDPRRYSVFVGRRSRC